MLDHRIRSFPLIIVGVVGRPGVDFPILSNIPVTDFSCRKFKSPGYYADLDTNCQVFHICDGGRKISFLCPNGTIFRQSHLICDWWFRVDCGNSVNLYDESAEQLAIDQRSYKSKAKALEKVSQPQSSDNQFQDNYNNKPNVVTAAPNSFYSTQNSFQDQYTTKTKASGNQPLQQNTFGAQGNRFQKNYNNNNQAETQAPQIVTPSPNTFYQNRFQDNAYNLNTQKTYDNPSGNFFSSQQNRIQNNFAPQPKAPVLSANKIYAGGNSLDSETQVLAESVNYGTGKQNRYNPENLFKTNVTPKPYTAYQPSTTYTQSTTQQQNYQRTSPSQQTNEYPKTSTTQQNVNYPQTSTIQQNVNYPQTSTSQQQNSSYPQSSTIEQAGNYPQSTTAQQSSSYPQTSTFQQSSSYPQTSTTSQQVSSFPQASTIQQSSNYPQSSTVEQAGNYQQSTTVQGYPQSSTIQQSPAYSQSTTSQQNVNYPQSTTIQQTSSYPQTSNTQQDTSYPQSTTIQQGSSYPQTSTIEQSPTYSQSTTVNDQQSSTYQQSTYDPSTTYQQGSTTSLFQTQNYSSNSPSSYSTVNNSPTSYVSYTTPFAPESSTPGYSTIKETTPAYSTYTTIRDSYPTTFLYNPTTAYSTFSSDPTTSPEFLSTLNFNRANLEQSNLVPETINNAADENSNGDAVNLLDSISIYYDQINNKESVRLPLNNNENKNKISVSDIFLSQDQDSQAPSASYDVSNSLPSVLTDSTKEGYSLLFSNGSSTDPSVLNEESVNTENGQSLSEFPRNDNDLITQQNQGLFQSFSTTVSPYTTPSTTTVAPRATVTESDKDLELRHSSDLRELAQVFSRALSAYLEDPENFRRILSEVRPTEPNIKTTTANPYKNEVLEFSEDNKVGLDNYRTRNPSSTPAAYSTLKDEYKVSSIANQVNNLATDTASSYFPPPRNLYGGFQNNTSSYITFPNNVSNIFEGTTQTYYSVSPLVDLTREPKVVRFTSTTTSIPITTYEESNTIGAQDVNNLAPSRNLYEEDRFDKNAFSSDKYDYSFGANAKKANSEELELDDQESLVPFDSQSIVSKDNLLRFQNAQKKYYANFKYDQVENFSKQPETYQTIRLNNGETIERTRTSFVQGNPQKIVSTSPVTPNYYYEEKVVSQGIPSSTYSTVNFVPTELPQFSESPQYYYSASPTPSPLPTFEPSSSPYTQNQFIPQLVDNGSMYKEAKELFGNLNETSANMLMDMMHEAESNSTLRRLVLLLVNDKTGKKTPEETRNKLLEALLQMPQRTPSYPPNSISRTYTPKVPRRISNVNMDEVGFHLSQCLDSLQIIFNNLVHSGKIVLQNVRDNSQMVLVQIQGCLPSSYFSTFHSFLQTLLHSLQQLRQNINASFYFYRGPFVLADTFNRTNAISATLGLVCGTGIGLVIGLCLQYSCAPVSSMKAIGCMNMSGIEDITLDDTAVPSILYSDQILVKVFAGSIDAVDIRIASGYASTLRRLLTRQSHNTKTHVPVILGRDCAGVVVEVGSAVSKFEIGDEGVLAEYVVLREDLVSKKPKTLSFEDSVSLAYSGSIAWDSIFHKADLNTSNAENKKILIHCASTGVGCILIQLCRLLDTHITVTCLSRAVQVMLGFGASKCIPLETPDLEEQLIKQRSRYDVVFNCRGGTEAHQLCLQLCSKQGKVVSAVPPRLKSDSLGFLLGMFYSLYVNMFYVLGRTSWDHVRFSYTILDQISNLVDSGHLRPVVGNIFKPQDHQKAFHIVDSNQAIGKTVINFVR
ncbi:hypothetical protein M8J76_010469 [Diaphorina citri]|nr:hypothetical protein M8J76_010469 [Diaphorina citri]